MIVVGDRRTDTPTLSGIELLSQLKIIWQPEEIFGGLYRQNIAGNNFFAVAKTNMAIEKEERTKI